MIPFPPGVSSSFWRLLDLARWNQVQRGHVTKTSLQSRSLLTGCHSSLYKRSANTLKTALQLVAKLCRMQTGNKEQLLSRKKKIVLTLWPTHFVKLSSAVCVLEVLTVITYIGKNVTHSGTQSEHNRRLFDAVEQMSNMKVRLFLFNLMHLTHHTLWARDHAADSFPSTTNTAQYLTGGC